MNLSQKKAVYLDITKNQEENAVIKSRRGKKRKNLRDPSINILALWVVDDDARPRVERAGSNVIIHKHHYILIL